MQNILMISEAKLKAFTDINNVLDTDLIKSTIREAQIIHITRLLGERLYETILDKIENDDVSGNYKTLLEDYVQDTLVYWSYYESLEAIYLRPRNNGLLQPQGGDNALAVDMQMYDKKRQSIKNKAEYFSERLVEFLCFNESLFPEYGTEVNEEVYPDKGIQFKSPIVFRNKIREDIEKMNIKVINSRYDYLPQ